jgi:hypothetical protein
MARFLDVGSTDMGAKWVASCHRSRDAERMSLDSHWLLLPLLAIRCASSPIPTSETTFQSSGDARIWWAPSLKLSSLGAIDRRLEEPFADVYVVDRIAGSSPSLDQKEIGTCATYFVLRPQGYEPRSEVDAAALKVEGAKCATLRSLRNAKRPANRLPFALNPRALTTLPADLAPAPSPLERQHREDARRDGKSWQGYDGSASLSLTTSSQARVTSAESITNIEVLGRADFDGDGRDDVMLLTVSGGTKGSWTEVRLRVLTADPSGSVLRVSYELPI